MATDENENVTPQDSSESSDSDQNSEYEEKPVQFTTPVKKANKYHPLNWYTPTVLSPILDVSPSLESREAENTTSTTTTQREVSNNSNSLDDVTESEVNSSSALSNNGAGKLKRSPAIIDFSDAGTGKMSKSTGDLPDFDDAALVEDSSTDQSISLITRSESALRHDQDLTPASSTNLLFEEISVPFYFTLPPTYTTSRPLHTSMDESLNRPKPTMQSRLSLVMSQMLLKEELKEALCLQRSKLADCEIEADERAEKVEKKLEQTRKRKGSLGSRKVHVVPDKHIFDGRWCSEPSLAPEITQEKFANASVQTDPLVDLSQLGKTLPTQGTYKKTTVSKEIKRVRSGKSKRKTTVAVNTQITWRALQMPADKDKKSALANFQGFSGITYGDLLDFSSSRRCAYCNNSNSNAQTSDALYAYFQNNNPRRVSLFNDYTSKTNHLMPSPKFGKRKGELLGECGMHRL